MKLLIFSVYDKAVNAYMSPFYARAKGEAIRNFMDTCKQADHPFNKYPVDYTLVYLGEYDDGAGHFIPVDPQRVISAVECVDNPFTEEKRDNGDLPKGSRTVM